jgi:hypothetical protein
MNKKLNSFELGLLKRSLIDEKEKIKIDLRQTQIERLDESLDPDSEEYDKLMLEYRSLSIKNQRINEPIFTYEHFDSNVYASDDFILFKYGYVKNDERYINDLVYKSRYDLSEGFYKIIKIYHLMDVLKERENKSFFNKNNPYQLKHDDITHESNFYKVLIIKRLQEGMNLKEAIEESIERCTLIRSVSKDITLESVINEIKQKIKGD